MSAFKFYIVKIQKNFFFLRRSKLLGNDNHDMIMNKWKRNPRVFNGEYITVTRRDDGSLRPNFKPVKTGKGFDVVRYALAVCNELRQALKGLVEKE